jgi:nitrate reductase delta subunit
VKRATAAIVFGCAAVLLTYPEQNSAADLEAVGRALQRLPNGPPRAHLQETADWLAQAHPMEAAATYVESFDLRRRNSLHLTFYRHGDTRERGMALTALVDVYRQAGFAVTPGELPDYLPAMLELAAVSPAGAAVLSEHRAALDALRGDLAEDQSVFTGAVHAVTDVLGNASRSQRDLLRRYRAQGPPSEQVGLEPFAPPEVTHQGVPVEITRR